MDSPQPSPCSPQLHLWPRRPKNRINLLPVRDGKQKKAALLIGINGLSAPNTDYHLLHGPHQDVAEMKSLLMKSYEYQEENIQVLVDDGVGNAQPDRRNIMLSIDNLVNGAEPGDKLFFLYSGHTVQVPKPGTDEDDMEGCLIPLDGEDHMIKDNELRSRLVDRLSVGVSLVAVFDSCHSASLLDLEHLRCNRVFVPWLSKRKRKAEEIQNHMMRRLVIPVQTPSRSPTSPTVYRRAGTSPTHIRSPRSSANTLYSPVLSPRQSRHGQSSPTALFRPKLAKLSVAEAHANGIEIGVSASRTSSGGSISSSRLSPKSHIPAPLKLWETNKENISQSSAITSPTLQSALPSAWTPCESPLASFCEGWCRLPHLKGSDMSLCGQENPSPKLPDVISFGSCKDSELSWENEEGVGMTQALIQVLRKNPHPTLKSLVTDVSHILHQLAYDRHRRAKIWKKYRVAHAIKSPGLGSFDTEAFQHPQIASHKPLNMDSKWDI
ncbi:hypothetical protein MSAN_00423800 [Mycena sanguinolenta]|uniref:Peptidase C14 caspase domain-containing protein n=1 Tax=Mycena sanguinolenta TaxID=230812 RepID=A0A8H6ZA87_9AGAR|nr:hypothetical protein MSAN_00423800 [Mycena sanguinolenta]